MAVEVVGERVAAAVESSRIERMRRLEARAKGEDGEGADLSDEERFVRMRGGSGS